MNVRAWVSSKLLKLLDGGALSNYVNSMFGGSSSAGIIVSPATAMQSAAVYSCIKVLAESIAQLPIALYTASADRTSKTLVDGDGLSDLLRFQPNEYQTSSEFFEMIVAHLELRGNSYGYINRTARGRVVEILPLQPDFVTVTQGDDGTIIYKGQNANGGQYEFGPGEMLHIRGLSLNGYLGISPIAYTRESIALSLAAERYGSMLFRNGAKMGGILSHPGKLSVEASKRLKESFDDATSGDNAHRTAVLEEGLKWEKVSMTPEDSQFIETRKMQRTEIASIFRVPPHMIGDLEKATFSNIEQQSLEFVQYSLMPRLKRIELALRRCAFTTAQRNAGMFAKFGVAELLRGDATARANFYASGIVNGWLTRNEARYHEDMNPLDGLDKPLVPLNMTDALNSADSQSGALPAPGKPVSGKESHLRAIGAGD